MKKTIVALLVLIMLTCVIVTSCSDDFFKVIEELEEQNTPSEESETTPTNYMKDVEIFEIDEYGVLSLKTGVEVPAEVIIPKIVDETTVTSLNDAIFESCSTLETVTINGQITVVSDAAFISCSSLTTVILEDGVTSIGSAAFADCSALTSVTTLGTTTVNYASDAFNDVSLITFSPANLFAVNN